LYYPVGGLSETEGQEVLAAAEALGMNPELPVRDLPGRLAPGLSDREGIRPVPQDRPRARQPRHVWRRGEVRFTGG
ncbi:MAG: hypothetical protein NT167_10945, partial [Verrucomicrobia bacterium]|nr:hypothetical protein [Verrucomicrobiota bacterium]